MICAKPCGAIGPTKLDYVSGVQRAAAVSALKLLPTSNQMRDQLQRLKITAINEKTTSS